MLSTAFAMVCLTWQKKANKPTSNRQDLFTKSIIRKMELTASC